MNDVSTPMMNLLEKALDVTSQRHKLVVANMANIDTPGSVSYTHLTLPTNREV